MASDDLVGLALPFILTLASILLSSLLVFFVFFKKPTPSSDLAAVTVAEPGPRNLSTPTSAAEPSASSGNAYEVFLSFRGPDTRKGFTDFLYESLKGAGVDVFRDDEELGVGEEIGPELVRGIEQSKISIPIFSKDYASSKWCLMEAALMMECRKMRNQLILPIFYDVTPNEVRHQTRSYAKAFSQHRKKYGRKQVQQWRHALAEIGALKGWELNSYANGHQGQLITTVVTKVLIELKKAHLRVTDELVGMDECVEDIMELLKIKAADVRIIGLWGMGGVGKTTLAKVIYNKLAGEFEGCSFLSGIREASQRHNGLEELQGQLVADLSRRERQNFANIDEGVKEIRRRFHYKKVLILLDDIDRRDQLEALAADVSSFGPGSRIIVTTRNREALRGPQLCSTYEVKEMDGVQALRLFCKHAFRKDHPAAGWSSLSRDIVETTGGLPLAIEIIGSLLSGKSTSIWQGTLKKLKSIRPERKVNEKLMISYDALDYEQKQVFLDIACFLIGEDKRIAAHMWDDCKFDPEVSIDVLVMMSLIKISDDHEIWMHDQLRDLGREIVRQENYKVPEKRSRLWCKEEVIDILKNCEGTKHVEAISLECERGASGYTFEGKNFKNLSKLRLLWLERADLAGDFQHLFSNLRWLSWQNSSFASTTTDLRLPKLVVLDLSGSKVRDEWNFWNSKQICGKLKVLNLSRCNELTTTPHFSMFPNLERLILEDCRKLSVVGASIEHLKHLSFLSLKDCSRVTELPRQLGYLKALEELVLEGTRIKEIPVLDNLKELEILRVNHCEQLSRLPKSIGCLTSLTDLVLDGCGIFELPASIGSLRRLRRLSAEACSYLREIPDTIGQLESLTYLNLSWTKIATLPDSIGNLGNLEVLGIANCDVGCLPSALGKLHKLKVMSAWYCRQLMGEIPIELGEVSALQALNLSGTKISIIPEGISKVSHLQELSLLRCEMLQTLPELPVSLVNLQVTCKSEMPIPNLCRLINLKILGFEECEELVVPRDIVNLSKLEILDFHSENIKSLPDELGDLPRLKVLDLKLCGALEYLPTLPLSLYQLTVNQCSELRSLPNLSNLGNLLELHLFRCNRILEIQGLGNLVSLTRLELGSCSGIVELSGLERLESLRLLRINSCENLERLPDLAKLTRLSIIFAEKCKRLGEIRGLDSLHALQLLNLSNCESLEALPEVTSLKLLEMLDVSGCGKLREIEGLNELKALSILRISRCKATEKLPSLSNLKSLMIFSVSGCEKLETLGLDELEALEELVISECGKVEKLPDLSKLKRLKWLSVERCEVLQEIEGLDKLESLEGLEILECGSIEKVPNASSLKQLKKLRIKSCGKLRELEGLEGLEVLEELEIVMCKSIEKLRNLGKLKSLTFLCVTCSEKLQELDGLDELEELSHLWIASCKSIKTLPDLSKLKRLTRLEVIGCDELVRIPGLDNLEHLESKFIRECPLLQESIV